MTESRLSVGVDVGGTFTDLAAIAPDGAVRITKVLTQPRDQSGGVMDALAALGEPGARVDRLVHGTTAVTNLLLERTGARVALCATAGHIDVLHLRRQDRAALYDLSAHHPAPLVARDHAVAVPERMGPEGVVRALDAGAIADVVDVRSYSRISGCTTLDRTTSTSGSAASSASASARSWASCA